MELYAPWVVIKIPVMDDKGKKRLGRMDQVRIKKHVCWQPDRLAFRRVAVFAGVFSSKKGAGRRSKGAVEDQRALRERGVFSAPAQGHARISASSRWAFSPSSREASRGSSCPV